MTDLRLHRALNEERDLDKALKLVNSDDGPALAGVLNRAGRLAHHVIATYRNHYGDSEQKTKNDNNILQKITAILLKHYPQGLKTKDHFGKVPIHYAVKQGKHIIIKEFVSMCPESLQISTTSQQLPIHLACRLSGSANNKRLELLVKSFSKGLELKDDQGKLPVHHAIESGMNEAGLELLITSFPKGLAVKDKKGRLPIHLAWTRAENLELLITKFPKGLEIEDEQGRLPIHYAAKARSLKVDILKRMVEAYPSGLKKADNTGRLPLHDSIPEYITQRLKRDQKDEDDRMRSKFEIVQLLVRGFPEGVKHKSKDGKLPVHIAAQLGSLDSVRFFAVTYPVGLEQPDNAGNLPLHLAAARTYSCHLPTIRFLAEKHKMAESSGDHPQYSRVLEEKNDLLRQLEENNNEYKGEKNLLLEQIKQQEKAFNEERLVVRKDLKEQHKEEKESTERAHAKEKENLKTAHAKEKAELERSLAIQKEALSHGRNLEKQFLANLVLPDNTASMEELKSLAMSLKARMDLFKAANTPNAKPSLIQLMFPSFIANPMLSKEMLIDCIEQLNAELIGLEADMEEGNGICNDEAIVPETTQSGESSTNPSTRPAKRPRVSLP